MKIILCFLLFILNLSVAFAARIVDVEPGKKGEDHMVMWSDGKVTFEAKLPSFKKEKSFALTHDEPLMSYEPTIMESEEAATKLLRTMRKPNFLQWNIQCYNMAMVRSYEAWKYHNVKSKKIFLFFTKSYLRKYRGKWWFHVTPLVHVNVEGKVVERVLDKEWSKIPLPVKTWTDEFIKSKATCPVITKYSAFEQNQETNHCYVYPISMYYWQPLHLMELEESRLERSEFKMSEVNTAYARDF
jgi:hypothetical protein